MQRTYSYAPIRYTRPSITSHSSSSTSLQKSLDPALDGGERMSLRNVGKTMHVIMNIKDQFLEKMPSSVTLVLMRFLSRQQAVKLYLALHKSQF